MQKIQNAPDIGLVIFTKIFVFDTKGIDPDPFKKPSPEFLLFLALFETLFNQFSVELRFSLDRFSFLHFPKTSLMRPRFRERLPEFVTPEDVYKLEARKSTA